MYNLLIVDDELIIREGLYELLSMDEKLELNLFTASSAIEAERILEERKVDIVLTDIKMPRMSGMELFSNIQERWPHCKVIFLTGYSEFDYVYKVYKHARYILKAEEDEKIIDTVLEVIEEMENDFMMEQIVQDGNLLSAQRKEQERNRFFYDLFTGFVDLSGITDDLLRRLDLDLDISEKMYFAVIRSESVPGKSYEEQIKIMGDLQILLNKYYFDFMKGVSFHHSSNYIIMLLQPVKWNTVDRNALALKGTSELFQKACLKNFDMTLSILFSGNPLSFGDILTGIPAIKSKLLMAGEEALILWDPSGDDGPGADYRRQQKRNLIESRLDLLDYYFGNSNRDHVVALLDEALQFFDARTPMDDSFGAEIFGDIAVRLLRYTNRLHLSEEEKGGLLSASKLYNLSAHASWTDAFSYLKEVCDQIFELRRAGQIKSNDDVIRRIKDYIQENLSGDTSLDTLADLVGLSPEYLLRRFKKREGITILQFINDLKIIKARNLISEKERQIKDIAHELGFSSSGYFGRFFKSKTGFSPQGYREQLN